MNLDIEKLNSLLQATEAEISKLPQSVEKNHALKSLRECAHWSSDIIVAMQKGVIENAKPSRLIAP